MILLVNEGGGGDILGHLRSQWVDKIFLKVPMTIIGLPSPNFFLNDCC